MKASFLRGFILTSLIFLIVAAIRLSHQMIPAINCSGDVEEGRTFYCSATLKYPPAQPRFSWDEQGDCVPDRLAGQTIRLSTPLRAQSHSCALHLAVYDSGAGGQLLGTADWAHSIKKTAGPLPPPPVNPVPSPKHPTPATPRPRIQLTTWPDLSQHQLIDGAPVQGYVSDGDVAHYKVAVYVLIEGKWELQGVGTINPETRKWDVVGGFGSAYAALLIKDSFDPRITMKTIPPIGGEIIDSALKKSN